jgi:purine-binding chemotaxis protein CheW
MAQAQSLQILTVGLEHEIFALEAACVREILDLVPVTAVPHARAFVDGLINVRGKVVPLADLRLRFGMAPTEATRNTRIVVIEVAIDGEPITVGLLADKVYEVTDLPLADIEATPPLGMGWRSDFTKGVGKRAGDFIIVLDINRVFNTDEPALAPA